MRDLTTPQQIIDRLPVTAGNYALHLQLACPTSIAVGRLGCFDFPPADYLYLGSARGPGGLRARLKHHLFGASHPHWHIDFLRGLANVTGIWTVEGATSLECRWSQAIAGLPGAQIPAAGFGASDCRSGCPSHLVAFPGGLSLPAVEAALRDSLMEESSLQYIGPFST